MKKSILFMMLLIQPLLIFAQASGGQIRRQNERTPQRSSQNYHAKPSKPSSSNRDVTKISNPDGYINGHGYIDLGLPSGTKWASSNVGASSPEDYGLYLAWGELYPKSIYTKQNSKTYGVKMNDISGNPKYDAANFNFGGSWRIPTKDEFAELIKWCKWTKTKYNNVVGYIVMGANAKSIFLPFGGIMLDDSIDNSIKYNEGCYWTSTPYTQDSPNSAPDDNDLAWYVFINADGPTLFYGNYMHCRGLGLNVRPVCN